MMFRELEICAGSYGELELIQPDSEEEGRYNTVRLAPEQVEAVARVMLQFVGKAPPRDWVAAFMKHMEGNG